MTDPQAHLAGFRAGSLLAGYRLETQVGAGGMAVVFRARDERLNRLVALKILAPALASDAAFRSRFIAESRAAVAVDDPYIIPIYEAGEAEGVLFIAMRLVQGGDLCGVLKREGALPPERAAGFISPVASALDAAHRAGLVHRDVKPANILVDAREDRPDHVYLSDFGVSKAIFSAGLTNPGYFVGTADYSAPEQIRGQVVDGRTDQYALACVSFQLLSGTLPFGSDEGTPALLAQLSVPPPSLAARRPGLPGAVDQVVSRAMAKDPEQRYVSCLEFAGALRRALGLAPFDPESPGTARAAQPAMSPSERLTLTAARAPVAGQRGRLDPGPGHNGEPQPPCPRPDIANRPGPVTVWFRRHRLRSLAVACAILVTAGAMAFARENLPKSASPAASSGPAKSTSPASGPIYGRVPLRLPPPYTGKSVASLAFSPSGTTLAIADLHVCLWDITAGAGCGVSTVFASENSVAFSPDGQTLAVGGATGRIDLLNVAAKRLAAAFQDPGSKGVHSVAFSPNGRTLAAADFNGHSYLWDISTGKLAAIVTDPGSKGVDSLAFSPNGRTLALGDENGNSYLWDLDTGTLAATLIDPGGLSVNAVAFSPGGKMLATGDQSGGIYFWRIR